jgi:HEAT repeat protein
MKHKTILVSLALVSLGGAAGAVVVTHRSTSSRGGPVVVGSAAQDAPTTADDVAGAPALSRSGWEPGVEYLSELDFRTSFGQTENDDPNAQRRLEFHLSGRWRTRVSGPVGDAVRVQLELQGARLESAGGQIPEEVRSALAAPFFADYDGHGRAIRLHVRQGLDPTVLGVLRELVSATQFSTPEQPSRAWTAFETDIVGEYPVVYRAVGGGSFLRQKAKYSQVAGPHGLAAAKTGAPVITAYVAKLGVDDWGRVATLNVLSSVKKPVVANGLAFESRTEISVRKVSRARDTSGLPLSIDGLVATTLTPGEVDFRNAANDSDRNLVNGADVRALLRDLTSATDDGARAAVQARLAALFRIDPAAAAQARAQMGPGNARVVIGALGEAGTPEAQKALASVLADPHADVDARKEAVDAVLGLEHPTRETGEALKGLLASDDPELKNNASLAYGAVAGRLAESEPDAAHSMVTRIADDYAKAGEPEERLRILGSLGNTRSSDALPVLSQSLSSSDPAVRAGAAAALRFVPDARADSLLVSSITKETDPAVRGAALMAAGYRSFEPLADALTGIAKGDDVGLRKQLVATLENMASRDGDSVGLLAWMAQNDPDSKVRAQAESALERVPTG